MRVLATSAPNQGHFYPMVPLLWTLRNAGHDVLIATAGRFTEVAAATGLPVVPLGEGEGMGEIALNGARSDQRAGTKALIEHVIDFYVPLAERHVAGTVAIAESWRPDLVIHTGWEYAGPIAAARLGVPAVLHGWGLDGPPELEAPVAEALAPLHEAWGLPDGVPDPVTEIDVCPPSMQVRTANRSHLRFGWSPYSGSGIIPSWLLERPERTRVCVTFGNIPIMGGHSAVLASVLEALRGLDVEILIAGSSRLDYGAALPEGARVMAGLPLSVLIRGCDLVIHHGGAGSVFTTLAQGLPALALPQMCVQYQHADRVAEVGAGLCLHPDAVDPAGVAKAIDALFGDVSYEKVARGLRREIADQPPASDIVKPLEAAVAGEAP